MESFLIPPFFISTSISPIPSHTGYGKRHGAPRLNVFPHLIAYPEIDTIGIRLLFCPSIQTGGKRGCFSMNQFGLVGFPYNARWITYFPDSRKWRGHFPWVWKQPQKKIPAVFLFEWREFVLQVILHGQVFLIGMQLQSWPHHVVKHEIRKR